MLKKLMVAGLLILAVFVAGGFFLPAQYHVERSIVIDRPSSVLFTLLNSYKNFNRWSPWAQMDPEAVFEFSGPETGPGARLSWSGDPRTVGEGWQEITHSQAFQQIVMRLDFGEQGIAQSQFDLLETDAGTQVTWSFDTDVTDGKGIPSALMGKYFGLFLDKWIGSDYEQGLAALKIYAESLPASDFSGSEIEIVVAEPLDILYVSGNSSQEATDIASALAQAFTEIGGFMAANNIRTAGQPMAITRSWDEHGYRFDAAIPVQEFPDKTSGNVQMGRSPSGSAVRYTHTGPYDEMLPAYEELASFMAANGLPEGPVSWEHYISDPGTTPGPEIITHIYVLIQD